MLQVFKVFGEIKEVSVEQYSGYALVTFADIVSAFFAQQSLNNFYLSKYNAQLQVKWFNTRSNQEATQSAQATDLQANQENIQVQ